MNRSRHFSGNDLGGLRLDVGLEFHKTIDYDRKKMRRALGDGAGLVRKEARRLLARRAIASKPGEIPAQQTGRLMRSIGVIKRGSKGGWVKVGPRSIKGSIFYPAFLFYGSPSTGLAKRGNYMEVALKNKRENIRSTVRAALKDSLVPR
jgi:hypothetical protein